MSDVSGDGSQLGSEGRPLDWRARYDAARARGIPLDPRSEPVAGVRAYPTAYDASHLLVTETDRLEDVLGQLRIAAADFGWGIELERVSGEPETVDAAVARARAGRDRFGLPTVYRVRIFPAPRPDRDDEPVPPIDAWRLLQRARARFGRDFPGAALDHVLTVDPLQVNPYGKTNPFGKTNPYGKTNPFGKTNAPGVESYADPGSGGRQVVGFVGPAPQRRALPEGGRRPVVAVLDTGCGAHPWLPDEVVDRHPQVDGTPIGVTDPATDPEIHGDVSGPFDGGIDEAAGHGTFIAGIVRQVCPDADIISVRVADSQGTVLESEFMVAVRSIVKWMSLPPEEGGRAIDVLNLSLSYYHETPEDELFDRTLSELLVAARRLGCVVVCSAGNEATDRPTFPASLWAWPHADFVVDDPTDAAPHLSVGALNPNGTMALFSNIGPWVRTCAPGVAVLSTSPPFEGGVEPGSRDDRWGVRRETIDPDDFSGGFALWSGTSFAAPFVAALFARALVGPLADGGLTDAAARIGAVKQAEDEILAELARLGPRTVTG